MAETPKEEKVVTPAPTEASVEAPAEKLVEVELSTQFTTNDDVYGTPESQDENGEPIYTVVTVPETIAKDLIRRQREYDRMKRELVTSRNFGQIK